jgi:hypothetical protein
MSDIVRSGGNVPASMMGTTSRLPKRVSKQLESAAHTGLIAAARVQAAAYTTHVAMQAVAMLSADEGHLIEACPLAEPRLKVLVDAFTLDAAHEIERLGW